MWFERNAFPGSQCKGCGVGVLLERRKDLFSRGQPGPVQQSLWGRSAASKEGKFLQLECALRRAQLKLHFVVVLDVCHDLSGHHCHSHYLNAERCCQCVYTHGVISSISGFLSLSSRTRQEWWHSSNHFHVGFLSATGSRQGRYRDSKHHGKEEFKAAKLHEDSRIH